MTKRIHATVNGTVQGVFYRDFIRREAEKLDIKGFVRNLKDGNVEIVAEGDEMNLQAFLKHARKGPLKAFVTEIAMKEEKPTGEFDGFDIRY